MSGDTKYLYAIKHPDGFFKIGRASGPYDRASQIQIGSPYELQLKYVVKAKHSRFCPNLETETHERLNEYHERGEWFSVPETTPVRTLHALVEDDGQEAYFLFNIPRQENRLPDWKQDLGRRVKL